MLNANSIGRIVSVTGAKAILMLDSPHNQDEGERPEMGALLAIRTSNSVVMAIVSALSVPVPAHREDESEIWIAELNLVGELTQDRHGVLSFNRGVTTYPALGDRVRVAAKEELELAYYSGPTADSVRIGSLRQESSIPAYVKVDDLLGKHFAVLGTTGTGKSCGTALILRAILDQHPNAHIVLLDPHNEYASAFKDRAEIISPANLNLPFWFLTFEEAVEVLIGDRERKAEIEILQELIPLAKARYSSRTHEVFGPRGRQAGAADPGRYTVDTPIPYRISDVLGLIDERMGRLENKNDLTPYRQLKLRIQSISSDARYGFMFGPVTAYDGMAQVLGRIFRVPVEHRPITILELTGLPTEIVNVVVSVICRMTFDFAMWAESRIPVTLVCEEAHRYIPANTDLGFEPCKRAIARIAKEGRKYGASLCIVTQRPAEIDPTILSQCNTVFALRMSNDRDQTIVRAAVSDPGLGLLEFLPALGQREAIAFGDGLPLPMRIRFDELPQSALPRSSGARFTRSWQEPVGDRALLEEIVDRWRAAGNIQSEASNDPLFASRLASGGAEEDEEEPETEAATRTQAERAPQPAAAGTAQPQPARAPAASGPVETSAALKSLRERLMQQRPQR